MSEKPTTIDHAELLERKANIARRRLMNTVDELDARKNAVEEEVKQASMLPVAAGAIGTLWLMTFVGGRVRRWNKRRHRRNALQRFMRTLRLAR
jgi:hypothetical protein